MNQLQTVLGSTTFVPSTFFGQQNDLENDLKNDSTKKFAYSFLTKNYSKPNLALQPTFTYEPHFKRQNVSDQHYLCLGNVH